MAYIYKITNDINQKIYVGKTEYTLEKRFKEHCADAYKERNEKRPLYAAMRKYGIEHFHIELIEETDNPDERETYWILTLNTYHNGYNVTLGGDGKLLFNHQMIINLYNQYKNCIQVSQLIGCSPDTVYDVLKANHIQIQKPMTNAKKVAQYDLNNNLLNIFISCGQAAQALIQAHIAKGNINSVTAKITECARKNTQRKTAYHYIWRYVD